MQVLMIWGLFPFAIESLPHESFDLTTPFKYGENSRVGARSSLQYLGQENETISITGNLYPLITGGRNTLEIFKLQASQGKAYPLLDISGKIHGNFVCTNVNEAYHYFEANNAPNKIEFTLEFKRVGDDLLNYASVLSTQMMSLIS